MALRRRSTIVFCVLAIAPFVATPIVSCLAEEVHSNAPEATSQRGSSLPPSSRQAAEGASRLEGQPRLGIEGGKFDGKGAAEPSSTSPQNAAPGDVAGARNTAVQAPVPAGNNIDGIDTRVAVPPHRPGERRDTGGQVTTVKSITWRNLLGRQAVSRGRSEDFIRNSIGMPVARREGFERRTGQHPDSSNVVHGLATRAMNANGSSRFAKAEGRIDRGIANINPVARPAVSDRGTINGTSVTRAGSSPSSVGGPAKSIAGINGATIRPKR
jgi:hypothetical protein